MNELWVGPHPLHISAFTVSLYNGGSLAGCTLLPARCITPSCFLHTYGPLFNTPGLFTKLEGREQKGNRCGRSAGYLCNLGNRTTHHRILELIAAFRITVTKGWLNTAYCDQLHTLPRSSCGFSKSWIFRLRSRAG